MNLVARLFLIACLLLAMPVPSAHADVFGEDEPSEAQPVPRYDPDAEALRSVLVPGWSQFRQGRTNPGWAYLMIAITSGVFLAGVFDVPLIGDDDDNFGRVLAGVVYGLNAVVSGFDAHHSATESNRENGWDLDQGAMKSDPTWRLPLVSVRF